jgi:hypothetical protein
LMIGLLMRWWTSFSRITKVGASFLAGSTVYGTKCQHYRWVFVFSFWIFAPLMGTPQVESCPWKWLCVWGNPRFTWDGCLQASANTSGDSTT